MNQKDRFIFKLYQVSATVFRPTDLALLFNNPNNQNLKAQINYYVKKGVLLSPRRGIYTKTQYDKLELATKIFSPSYISLQTVLLKESIIFQPYETIFCVSYLTRLVKIDGLTIQYRKVKNEVLLNPKGITREENYSLASKERAFLDSLYFYGDYYVDNPDALDRKLIKDLLPLYGQKTMYQKAKGTYS